MTTTAIPTTSRITRCRVRGCAWRGRHCGIHSVRHPAGYAELAALVSERPYTSPTTNPRSSR